MASISALIHTFNDERQLGRTLETLRPCDEIVVVDHASNDQTARVARQYGAKIIPAVAGVQDGAYATDCKHDWVLSLLPTETLSETLEASLFEWKTSESSEDVTGYALGIRRDGKASTPELRLVNRTKMNWRGITPEMCGDPPLLQGDVLQFEDADEPSTTPK
jgi:glycosyltransferase involved in cell wall biosynthesis